MRIKHSKNTQDFTVVLGSGKVWNDKVSAQLYLWIILATGTIDCLSDLLDDDSSLKKSAFHRVLWSSYSVKDTKLFLCLLRKRALGLKEYLEWFKLQKKAVFGSVCKF